MPRRPTMATPKCIWWRNMTLTTYNFASVMVVVSRLKKKKKFWSHYDYPVICLRRWSSEICWRLAVSLRSQNVAQSLMLVEVVWCFFMPGMLTLNNKCRNVTILAILAMFCPNTGARPWRWGAVCCLAVASGMWRRSESSFLLAHLECRLTCASSV